MAALPYELALTAATVNYRP